MALFGKKPEVERVPDSLIIDHISHFQERWINLHTIQPKDKETEKFLNGRKFLARRIAQPIPHGAWVWITPDHTNWSWSGGLNETTSGQFMQGTLWDLSNRNLNNLDLRQTTFTGYEQYGKNKHVMNLSNSNFSGSDLSYSQFTHCDLRGADFNNTDLHFVIFSGCNLRGANFDEAQLSGTQFKGGSVLGKCDLRDTRFSGATTLSTNFESSKIPRNWEKYRNGFIIGPPESDAESERKTDAAEFEDVYSKFGVLNFPTESFYENPPLSNQELQKFKKLYGITNLFNEIDFLTTAPFAGTKITHYKKLGWAYEGLVETPVDPVYLVSRIRDEKETREYRSYLKERE